MEKLLEKLKSEGGCIVSSGDCSEMEIADAQARGDFYVDANHFGYVRRLPGWLARHSRFARNAESNNCEVSNQAEMVELLRSAHNIALRKGEDVAWERFAESIANIGIGPVTARVYKVLQHEKEQ